MAANKPPTSQPIPMEAPPAPPIANGNAEMPPAKIQIIEKEIAKFEKPPMCRLSSCSYPIFFSSAASLSNA